MNYRDTKLIVFLKTFPKNEFTEFELFLTSPFFKTGRDLLPFLKTLKKYHPDFSSDNFTEENIFKELYPESAYSGKKSKDIIRTLSSSLFKSAEEFLYISKLRDDKVLRNKTILKDLLHRNLTKYYEQYLKSAYDELESNESESGKDYLERFYLERLSTRYYSLTLDFKNMFEHTNKSVELLSTYFLLDLIRTSNTNYLGGLTRNIKIINDPVEKLLEVINLEDVLKLYIDTPQYFRLCFSYYTSKCMKNKNESALYEKAKKLFFDNKSLLSRYEKNFFYADLLNIVQSRNVTEDTAMKKEIFFLVNSCLKDKAYKISDADYMQPDFYRNAVLIANYFKEYDWIDNFIKKYTDELKPEYRNNMKYYSLSLIYFGKCDFENSLEAVSKVKYDLDLFKIDLKILMAKIFYELNLNEQAQSLADTFKHFIRNSEKMRPEIKEAHSNFLRYYLNLFKMKSSGNFKESEFILNEMIKEKYLFQKIWLTEKVKEFETKITSGKKTSQNH